MKSNQIDRNRWSWRFIGLIALVSVVVVGCSSGGEIPSAFDGMGEDEVGCTVRYGDEPERIVGPLAASDFDLYAPNDFTAIRVGRTASDVTLVVTRSDAGAHSSVPMNEFEPGEPRELVFDMTPSGQPGVRITCWRGPVPVDG